MNNDLISREDLKEALAKEIKTNDLGLWLKILSVIDNVPTNMKEAIANGTPYNPTGDCISRSALKKDIEENSIVLQGVQAIEVACAKVLIDSAQAVADRYDEGYAQGYVDGSTGADWKGGAE